MIEFGRRPTWNCPKDDDDRKQNTDDEDEDDTDDDKFDSNFDEKFDQDISVNPSAPTVDQNLRPAVRSRQRLPTPTPSPTPTEVPAPALRQRPPADLTPPPFVDPSSSSMFSASTASDLSMRLSPPTQPEVKSGGFVPNLVDQTSGESANLLKIGAFRIAMTYLSSLLMKQLHSLAFCLR